MQQCRAQGRESVFVGQLDDDRVVRGALVGGEHRVDVAEHLGFMSAAAAVEIPDDGPLVFAEFHVTADTEIRVALLRRAADDQLAQS